MHRLYIQSLFDKNSPTAFDIFRFIFPFYSVYFCLGITSFDPRQIWHWHEWKDIPNAYCQYDIKKSAEVPLIS